MHLIIDGKAPRKRLEDTEFIYGFLECCPQAIGMTRKAPPYVFSYVSARRPGTGA